jgi:hypothetical protein
VTGEAVWGPRWQRVRGACAAFLAPLIPAEAGIQSERRGEGGYAVQKALRMRFSLDPGFRRDERGVGWGGAPR